MATRTTRTMSNEQRKKIADALKDRNLSNEHKSNISKGLKNYWNSIPKE